MDIRNGPYTRVKLDITMRLVSLEQIGVMRDHPAVINDYVFHYFLPLSYPGGLRDMRLQDLANVA
jgi:hypothetical protein